jgi:phosphatidylserine/phosphatidylglycerophosphate/cardiolipin synthase-like enzyme
MHHKFCVIDNQVVLTGSYNWTTNAETRNDENVTVQKDPESATKYSLEFNKLKKTNINIIEL